MPDSILAALAGLCSAGVLEVLRHVLARGQKIAEKSVDDATAFRHDLLARISALEEDQAALAKERDEWRDKYYAEREQRVRAEWQLETLEWIAQEHDPEHP
ncbi:MAG: hypothetical protein M3347_02285 [Armatimonadota bacterium]|nr:hypothetical protein [Armatimonadota bacterium]